MNMYRYRICTILELTVGGATHPKHANSSSSWFCTSFFETHLFLRVFVHYDIAILLGEILASYLSHKVIKECINNGTYLLTQPADTIHLIKRLDAKVFASMKKSYRRNLELWRKKSWYLVSIWRKQFPLLQHRFVT